MAQLFSSSVQYLDYFRVFVMMFKLRVMRGCPLITIPAVLRRASDVSIKPIY